MPAAASPQPSRVPRLSCLCVCVCVCVCDFAAFSPADENLLCANKHVLETDRGFRNEQDRAWPSGAPRASGGGAVGSQCRPEGPLEHEQMHVTK